MLVPTGLRQAVTGLLATGLITTVSGLAVSPVVEEQGVAAHLFDLTQIQLTDSRWMANQERTLTYLKYVDMERLLYVFRATHGLSTNGAEANGGWDAPDFPFRSHVQGHILTAWSQCWAALQDQECYDRAVYFVEELAKCQAENDAANSTTGFSTGYLSGYPESDIDAVINGTLTNGNVPWYTIHKTLAGLLDVWRHVGSTVARDTALALADWTHAKLSPLDDTTTAAMLQTEYGGMADVLVELYRWSGNATYLSTAQYFDVDSTFSPLASDLDQLSGLHANTQLAKWIGAVREYKQTGDAWYLSIARNAWQMVLDAHLYTAMGGNSQAEHFHDPDVIAGLLTDDNCEACNSYNMLKLTRELWTLDPTSETTGTGGSAWFDFYENAMLNHLLGQQNPDSDHGHVTYFTPLIAGGRRGVGPAWGGGTWSTDYDTFWCCQGTGVETNTKYMDSIYGYDDSSLYVNLFIPSQLTWADRGIVVAQATEYPLSDTTTLTITGTSSTFTLNLRIPSWATSSNSSTTLAPTILLNGDDITSSISPSPGTYASISRTWSPGDVVTLTMPMSLRLVPANDDPEGTAAVAYGPMALAGDYGDTDLGGVNPTLDLGSLVMTSGGEDGDAVAFTATVDGVADGVTLSPFYEMNDVNYVVYWSIEGSLPS